MHADAHTRLTHSAFSFQELPDALRWLGGAGDGAPELAGIRHAQADRAQRDRWVKAVAAWAGFEATFVSVSSRELAPLLATGAHVLLTTEGDPDGARVLLARRRDERRVELCSPQAGPGELVDTEALLDWALRGAAAPFASELDAVFERLPATPARRRVRAHMTSAILGSQPVAQAWVLTPAGLPDFAGGVRQAQLGRRVGSLVLTYALQYAAFLAAWGLVGRATFEGRVDRGYLMGALLLFATAALVRAASSRLGFDAVLALSALLKRWLLRGALHIELDLARRHGAGQLLGLVLESREIEHLALDGALLGLLAGTEVLTAALLLFASPVGWPAGLCLVGLLLAGVLAGRRVLRAQRAYTAAKGVLAQELIEGVVGHRTRLAQCPPEAWHDREEEELEAYRRASEQLDRAQAWLRLGVGRAGMAVGFLALSLPIINGASGTDLVIAAGAVLLAHGGVDRFTDAVARMIGARVSFEQIRPLFDAASRHEPERSIPRPAPLADGTTPLFEARGLRFRYAGGDADVLAGASLQLRHGDRVLIEAPSGTGKSTLLSLLSGLRPPSSGSLFSRGCERRLLGTADWRERVVSVPQFNENHVLSGTLAFNCLMGRGWPARPEDVVKAENVLKELALGRLLDAMPARMEQAVGETGWRLSHGERSRLYVARALLQDPDVLLIDESFGALDPETYLVCLRYVEKRARAMVLVAHR